MPWIPNRSISIVKWMGLNKLICVDWNESRIKWIISCVIIHIDYIVIYVFSTVWMTFSHDEINVSGFNYTIRHSNWVVRCAIAFNAFQEDGRWIWNIYTLSIGKLTKHQIHFKTWLEFHNMSITSPLNSCRCDSWCILMTAVVCYRVDVASSSIVGELFCCTPTGYIRLLNQAEIWRESMQ